MSFEVDSSEEEDEMLLSYVDSYRQQLALKQQQQTQATQVKTADENTESISEILPTNEDIKDELHIAKGQIAVLKEKYDKTETLNIKNRGLFLREKEQIENKLMNELNTLKKEINNLNDEKSFLKQRLKQANRNFDSNSFADNNHLADVYEDTKLDDTKEATPDSSSKLHSKKRPSALKHNGITSNRKDSKTEVKLEQISNEMKKNSYTDEEPRKVKPKLDAEKNAFRTKSIFNFNSTLKFNDNYFLMSHLTKYKIPGMPETVIHYLNKSSTSGNDYFKNNALGSVFLKFGNDLIITEKLSKFIELLLDFCLTKINDIIGISSEEDNKYIPFFLALIYQIINYRASACDIASLKNLFLVLGNNLSDFEYIFKLQSVYDLKLTMILPKYEVVTLESKKGISRAWTDLGTETSLINDENLFLKQHTSLLSTAYNDGSDVFMDEFEDYEYHKTWFKNKPHSGEGAAPQDHLFEVPNFNSEFIDFLIVVYTFDILETIVSNIDFLINRQIEEESEEGLRKNDFNELVDYYVNLFKLSFTNSFQPIIQPLFSNVKMFSNIFSISCKLNLNLNKFVDLISMQCEWLLKINLKNYLHKLPIKYHIVSLKRYVNGGENISYVNLITPLVKIMSNEINQIPDCNKFVIIHKACEVVTGDMLTNVKIFLDTWFVGYVRANQNIAINLDDIENSVIVMILKNCTTLLTTNFLACQGSKNKKDLDLKRENAIKCIKILQLFKISIDTLSEIANRDKQETNQKLNSFTLKSDSNTSFSSTHSPNEQVADTIRIERDRMKSISTKLSQLFINDESWKKELVVFTSRIIFQDQKNLLLKHELLKDFLRDLLDSLVTFDESEAIYDTLII